MKYQLDLFEEISEDLIAATKRSERNEIKLDIVYE